MTAEPCVRCGTTEGYTRPGAGLPLRVRGMCHSCYNTCWSNDTFEEYDRTTSDVHAFLQAILSGTAPRTPLPESPKIPGCIIAPPSIGRQDGYPQIRIARRSFALGREVLKQTAGPPVGKRKTMGHILSGKGCPKECVAPEHLEWQTQREQIAQQMTDGTKPRGSRHGRAKLTEEQVIEILTNYHTSREFLRVIAERYDVHLTTIWGIVSGKTWKHLHHLIPAQEANE